MPALRANERVGAHCRVRALPLCALVLALAGCSSSIGYQKDGTYILEKGEASLDCTRLANAIWGRMQVLRSLPDKAKSERAAAAPTAVQAIGRIFGNSGSLPSLKEYDQERAHVRSLHRTSLEKGCPPIDIERELAATDAAIAEHR